MTKTYNPPAADSGFQNGDKVYVIDKTGGKPRKLEGYVKEVLETRIRVRYKRGHVTCQNDYLPTRLEKRND